MQFFVLKKRNPEGTEFVPASPQNYGDAPRCPTCGLALGSRAWLTPHVADIEILGDGPRDIAFGPGDGFLASERFVRLYNETKLSGLTNFSIVTINNVTGPQKSVNLPDYFFAEISRGRAVFDSQLSGAEYDGEPKCPECRLGRILKRVKKIVLETQSWSGEDVFYAKGLPGVILTTERFVTWHEQHFNTRLPVVPIDEYGFDHYPWEKSA